jgi:class 3 adenylate cyclase/tetratricopeptide (TPR) repeat protein
MTTDERAAGACPACGVDSPADASFCMRCGHRLADGEPAPAQTTLRFVTVLFGDIVGSTELAAGLPAEVWAGLLDSYFRTVRTAIEDRGGRVEKFIGDAVVAVFGAEATHEDDAIRAVRAAIDACQGIVDLAGVLRRTRGLEFAARFTVASGLVAVTDRTSSFAIGEVLNRAARLQQGSPADGVVMDLKTWLLVRSAVAATPISPITAKGFVRPLRAYLVGDHIAAGPPRAPLIDRTALLDAAVTAIRQAVDGIDGSVLVVEGDLGVGKTRVLHELAQRVRGFARVVLTTSGRDAGWLGYWPLYHLAAEIAKTTGFAAEPGAQRPLAGRMGPAVGGETAVSQSKEELFWTLRRTLFQAAAASPVVLMLDDSQWLSPVVTEFLDALAVSPPCRGIAIVICGRQTPRMSASITRLSVPPLGQEDTQELFEAICGDVELHGAPLDLAERSAGNPLFLEQLIQLALDQEGGQAHGWTGLIAPSAEAAVGARLDLLSARARRTLGVAATIGSTLRVAELESIGRSLGLPVGETLREILGAGLLESDADGGARLTFVSPMVAEVAYHRLPLADRARAHQAAAREIEECLGAQPSAIEPAALHAQAAHVAARDLDPGSVLERDCAELAARLACEAGHFAVSRRDLPRAAVLVTKAAALAENLPGLRLEALALLGYVEGSMGRARDALQTTEQALIGAAAGENRAAAAHLLLNAVVADLALTGRWRDEDLDEARRLAASSAEPSARARVLFVQGMRLMSSGDYAAAEPVLRQAMDHVHQAALRFGAAEIFGNLGLCLVYGDTPADEAAAGCLYLLGQPALEEAHVIRAALSCPAAISIDMTGDTAGADRLLEEAAAVFSAIGHEPGSAGAEEFRAALAQRRGHTALAASALDRAAARHELLGFTFSAMTTRLRAAMLRHSGSATPSQWADWAAGLPDDWSGRILARQAEALAAVADGQADEAGRRLTAALGEIRKVRGTGARIAPLLACLRISDEVGNGPLTARIRGELGDAARAKQDAVVSAALIAGA